MEEDLQARPKRNGLKITAAVIIVLALLVGGAAFYGWYNIQPPPPGEPVRLTIPQGTGTLAVARLLEQNGLVRNGNLFAAYLKYKGLSGHFKAGQYEITPGTSIDRIIAQLNNGEIVKAETLKFTIPEGYTLKQIADKLAAQKTVDAAAFVKLADEDTAVGAGLPEPIPSVPGVKHRLEGYLFPDTYEMKKDSSGEDILKRMVDEWSIKLAQLPGWQDKLKARGLSFHQWVTYASLIEEEVAVDAEKPIVAGVIENRLKQNMRLQIDATVQYALGQPKERLFDTDLKVESPYNTYLHEGLPPGPIASPGLASLKAALEPQANDYLYYVTKKDGSREHLFAKTLQEHNKNIELSKKNAQ